MSGAGAYYVRRDKTVYVFEVCEGSANNCGPVQGFALGVQSTVEVVRGGSLSACDYGMTTALSLTGGKRNGACTEFDVILEGRVPIARLCRVVVTSNGDTVFFSSPSGGCAFVVQGSVCSAFGGMPEIQLADVLTSSRNFQ